MTIEKGQDGDLQGGWTPAQIRKLKIAVIAMGVLLVVGFAALIVGLYHKMAKPATSRADQTAPGLIPRPEGAPAAPTDIALPPDAEILSVALDGDALAVHVRLKDGAEIILIDAETGAQRARIRLRRQ